MTALKLNLNIKKCIRFHKTADTGFGLNVVPSVNDLDVIFDKLVVDSSF